MILTLTRNPPSYFLKRDGGFAYVIINLKTKASINSLGVDVYIYRYMISFGFSDYKPCRLSQAGRENYK